MSRGNTPTIKRILREASELSNHPTPDLHAAPLSDSDLFEWHFTLRGPPAPSPFSQGVYHGRISLPPQYPLRPPSFRFLTPSGRFEVNREICLSISGHHEETWQPAWGIRTALTAIRAFMDSPVEGQVGGLECSEEGRRGLAEGSRRWVCRECSEGKTNEEILEEEKRRWVEMGGASSAGEGGERQREEDKVPEELRLAYRDQLGNGGQSASGSGGATPQLQDTPASSATSSTSPVAPSPAPVTTPIADPPAATPLGQVNVPTQPQPQPAQANAPPPTTTLDHIIWALLFLLAGLVWRKLGKMDQIP